MDFCSEMKKNYESYKLFQYIYFNLKCVELFYK
jgi:hypothetical protein